ncbi:DUF917 family protein [Agrococcus sp. DT81.2]|uniref:S-methyl thiohydantoin desulfurase domain-containing protein n=1 Tax=Agrococcus sp. DT81.2 TaxID=3393414 RepID=UPI003CE56926
MPWTLDRGDLAALSRGAALLSGGGGGHTRIAELTAAQAIVWPIVVHTVDEVDQELPCVAVGVGGSTMVFRERLAAGELFAEAIQAVDRWTGAPARAVCLTEIGGMNALTALPHAGTLTLVDADLMGRALPGIDQVTLLVDDLPGLVIAVSPGPRGAMLVADARPADAEHVLRAAFEAAGGWAGMVVGGFLAGALAEHAVVGSLRRAFEMGTAWGDDDALPLERRTAAAGGRYFGAGRVTAVELHREDARVRIIDVEIADGSVLRLVARSEVLACVADGLVVARAPDVIDVVDPQTGTVQQVEDIVAGTSAAVIAFEAPSWWSEHPHRLRRVLPSHYGLRELDEVSG